MATILFIIANHTGHLNSTYQIARSLRARGHTIIYLGVEEMREKVWSQGFTFQVAPFLQALPAGSKLWEKSLPSEGLLKSLKHNFARIRTLRRKSRKALDDLKSIPPQIEEIIQRQHPDLLVFDPFLLMYYMPFQEQGIQAVAVSIFPLFDADPWVPPHTSDLIPGKNLTSQILVKFSWLKCRLQYMKYRLGSYLGELITGSSARALMKTLARETHFQLKQEWRTRPLSFDCKFKSVPELIMTDEAFDFPRKKLLPANTYYVGPCVDLERKEEEFSWEGIEPREKLIFCSLGTVNIGRVLKDKERFLRKVIEVARNRSNYSFILVTGHEVDLHAFSEIPSNTYVYASAPQLEVLKRAHLMIHHGGSNSIKECVFAGVPMLVYPMRADQPGNSARIVYHQIGLRGVFRRDSITDIDAKIKLLITDPRFRINLERMRQRFLQYQNAQRGIEIVEQFIKTS